MPTAHMFRFATLSPLVLLTASLAHATNLSEMVPKWTTVEAEDGRGIATDVALDSEGGLGRSRGGDPRVSDLACGSGLGTSGLGA